MIHRTISLTPVMKARIAGATYVLVFLSGIFTQVVHGILIEKGDAGATAANLLQSQSLFRLAFASDLVGVAGYVVVTVLLLDVFRPASRTGSLLAMAFSMVGCAVLAATFVFSFMPLLLLGGSPYLAPFRTDQLQAMAMLCLKSYALGYTIAMVFFGLYCFSLGALTVKSALMPRLIGVALVIAGIADLIDSFSYFISPSLSAALSDYTAAPAFVGEGMLCVWLLVFGVAEPNDGSSAGGELPLPV